MYSLEDKDKKFKLDALEKGEPVAGFRERYSMVRMPDKTDDFGLCLLYGLEWVV